MSPASSYQRSQVHNVRSLTLDPAFVRASFVRVRQAQPEGVT